MTNSKKILNTLLYLQKKATEAHVVFGIGGSLLLPRSIRPIDKIHDIDIVMYPINNSLISTAHMLHLKPTADSYYVTEEAIQCVINEEKADDYYLPITIINNMHFIASSCTKFTFVEEESGHSYDGLADNIANIFKAKIQYILNSSINSKKHLDDIIAYYHYLQQQQKPGFHSLQGINILYKELIPLTKKALQKFGKIFQISMLYEELGEFLTAAQNAKSTALTEETIDSLFLIEEVLTALNFDRANNTFKFLDCQPYNIVDITGSIGKVLTALSHFNRKRIDKNELINHILKLKRLLLTKLHFSDKTPQILALSIFEFKIKKLKNYLKANAKDVNPNILYKND